MRKLLINGCSYSFAEFYYVRSPQEKWGGWQKDEMAGWHHWLNGQEPEQAPGDGEGQGSLPYCSTWGCKELDMTEWLNNKCQSLAPYFIVLYIFFYFLIREGLFYWRITALQCCVGFCHTLWISHKYIHIPSHLNLPPTLPGCHRIPGWVPCVIQQHPN